MQHLSLDQACFVAMRARQVDVVDEVQDDDASNPVDDDFAGGVSGSADAGTTDELTGFIETLDEDRQVELVALVWLGRGDFAIEEWDEAVRLARERHTGSTASYLMGIPSLADYVTEGLAAFELSCVDMDDVS